jgi:DNA-binding MurR/RpiR family transcriptional regulator
LTRRQNPASVLDDRLGRIGQDGHDYDKVLNDTIELVQQVRASMNATTWQAAVEAVHEAHRVFTYGIGPASSLADYLAIMFNRIGVESHSWALTGFRLADALLNLRSDDAVIVFAPLRLFREIDVIVEHANNLGARVIVISEALGLSLADRADVVLATPQSTTNAASELTAGHLLAHALTLAVAARSRDRSVQTMEMLNQLRSRVAGTDLDLRPLHAIEPNRAD